MSVSLMGIDVHGLQFLMFARRKQPFGRVATIGRQAILVQKDRLKKLMKLSEEVDFRPFCEDLLKGQFGAVKVDSFDYSDYENATHLVDMNKPLAIEETYDTVFDGGSIEHIYNAPQALANVSAMCAHQGQILHMLPANNFCGHGFWQFSPELFFSLYSESNGYEETQVFLADMTNERIWFEVRKPQDGKRAEVLSSAVLYVLVRTRKTGRLSHENVQQSDYLHSWGDREHTRHGAPLGPTSWKQRLRDIRDTAARAVKSSPTLLPVARFAQGTLRHVYIPTKSLSAANPHLIKRMTATLI
jgi:hypothetical protein